MEVSAEPRSPLWIFVRLALGVGFAVALGYVAFISLIVGLIVFTGCFWACAEPNPQPVLGVLLFAGTVAAAGGIPTSLVAGFVGRRAPLWAIFLWSTVAATVLLTINFVNG